MFLERLLRDVDTRLQDRGEELRAAVQDAIRETVARERRAVGDLVTLESERERRVAAEEIRELLEAIGRPASTHEALAEALQHSSRALDVDAVVIAAAEPASGYRVLAALGDADEPLAGRVLAGATVEAIADSREPTVVADSEAADAVPCPAGLSLRSWMALPMLHEGQRIGLLVLGRRAAAGFTEEGVRRARQIAFAVSATLARHLREEQLRRYALMLEQVVELDQKLFRAEPLDTLLQATIDGACRVAGSRAGMLVLQTPHGPEVGAATGEVFAEAIGRPAPATLASTAPRRLSAERMLDLGEALGVALPFCTASLVPLVTQERYVGCLALLDETGPSGSDLLAEAFASRAAVALRFALSTRPRD